jgi:hypothetical protein
MRRALMFAAPVLLAVAGLAACGDDDDSAATTAAAAATTTSAAAATTTKAATTTTKAATTTTKAATTTTKAATTTTRGGGGATTSTDPGMQAGAPSFTSFALKESSVACEGGNATVHFGFETINVVDISIKIGDGKFEETAGYNPNETDVVAEIPCTGAATSSIQLKGCTEDNECAESEVEDVTITA